MTQVGKQARARARGARAARKPSPNARSAFTLDQQCGKARGTKTAGCGGGGGRLDWYDGKAASRCSRRWVFSRCNWFWRLILCPA